MIGESGDRKSKSHQPTPIWDSFGMWLAKPFGILVDGQGEGAPLLRLQFQRMLLRSLHDRIATDTLAPA